MIHSLRLFTIPLILLILVALVYYIYPLPNNFWLTVHKSSLDTLHSFTSAVHSEILYTGFRNNGVGPSTISLVLTGSTPFNEDEFKHQLQLFAGTKLENYDADANGIYSLLDFDSQCKWPFNGNTSVADRLQRTSPGASRFSFSSASGNQITVFYYPTTTNDEIVCNGNRLKGNLFTIKLETIKRYPL